MSVQRRDIKLLLLFILYQLNTKFDVLITEHSKDGNYYVGHNKYYDQVKYSSFF